MESELVDMRRLINKKCQQIFAETTTMIDPAKIFSDMLEISQKNKESHVDIPKPKEYLLDMTPIPRGSIKSTQMLSVSKSNISILGMKKNSDRIDMIEQDANIMGWHSSNNGYFSLKVPTNKKMIRVASYE
jgi:hypothetical protein